MPTEHWRNKQLVKDLAIVGHGRGATSYAAYWLIRQNIAVEHERMGRRGIVESGFSVPTWGCRAGVNQGLTRDHFVFRNKMCILRDPYKVIATYEQVEHPRAIFNHVEHLPGLVDDLLPLDFEALPEAAKLEILENDRELRVNAIARSVVRWTTAGIVWCDGWSLRAEDQWDDVMPMWLNDRGLWTIGGPRAVEKNSVNHRKGIRLSRDEINEFLRPDVREELNDYCKRMGYDE